MARRIPGGAAKSTHTIGAREKQDEAPACQRVPQQNHAEASHLLLRCHFPLPLLQHLQMFISQHHLRSTRTDLQPRPALLVVVHGHGVTSHAAITIALRDSPKAQCTSTVPLRLTQGLQTAHRLLKFSFIRDH